MGPPHFKVGDLVKACYTFYDFYTFDFDEDDELFYPWKGIVVSVYYDEEYFGDEPVYEVICTDGTARYFADWELKIVSPVNKS